MKELYRIYFIVFLFVTYFTNLILMFFSKPLDILIANLILLLFIILLPLMIKLAEFLID